MEVAVLVSCVVSLLNRLSYSYSYSEWKLCRLWVTEPSRDSSFKLLLAQCWQHRAYVISFCLFLFNFESYYYDDERWPSKCIFYAIFIELVLRIQKWILFLFIR